MSTEKTRKNTKGNRAPRTTPEQASQVAKTEQNLLDRSKYNLGLVNSWIFAADSKISTSCGIVSVVTGVLVFVSENLLSKIPTDNGVDCKYEVLFVFFSIGAVITFLLSLFFHLWALSPSFLSGFGKTNINRSVVFYEDIKNYESAEQYVQAVKKTPEDKYVDEIFAEVYYNSIICSDKMHRFKIGEWLALGSIVLILLSSLFYVLMYHH